MNPFEFVLFLMGMIFLFSIIKHKMGIPSRRRSRDGDDSTDTSLVAENRQLLEEVRQLKDRVKVLERIAVEKENSLAREIDDLRDR